jgi:hypothetical protein
VGKTWVLDTSTKGTGANVVPLEKLEHAAEAEPRRPAHAPTPAAPHTPGRRADRPRRPSERTATALPPGHVRKKSTGELGKVRSVDSKAGTAVVFWLRHGQTSTVPVSSISRR